MSNNDSKRVYPNAPWELNGKGMQAVFLVKSSKIQHLIPEKFKVVNVLPGYTIGLISAGIYDNTSSLEYSELIICPALIKYQGKKGFYISQIHVDDSSSIEGGKEIWKVEKQMSTFKWFNNAANVEVFHANQDYVNLKAKRWFRLPLPSLTLRAYSADHGLISSFVGKTKTRSKMSLVRIRWGEDLFFLPKRALGVYHLSGQLIANEPDIIEAI